MAAEIYVFNSSSKGNCCLIKNQSDVFLIDAGVPAKRICCAMKEVGLSLADIRAIFITHEHSDHIKGLEVLYHTIDAPLYVPPKCVPFIRNRCPSTEPFLIPTEPKSLTCLEHSKIYSVRTPHDSIQSVGFRMELSGEIVSYFTDIGHLSDDVVRAISGSRRLIIESNHDIEMLKSGPYPPELKNRILGPNGHLSNQACSAFLPHLASYGTKCVMLAHLSEENNTPELAFSTSKSVLPDSMSLQVASPYETREL